MLLASQATIFTGADQYTTNHKIDTHVHYVTVCLFAVALITLEFLHRRFLAQEPVKFNEPLNTMMSEDEFSLEVSKGKAKLVILDDLAAVAGRWCPRP